VTLRSRAYPRGRNTLGFALLGALALGCGGERVILGSASPFHFGGVTQVTELAAAIGTSENPTLLPNLLEIYFTSDRPDSAGNTSGSVWFASRTSADLPFAPPVAVAALNTESFETSAAISADGLTLWVGSDRAGAVGAAGDLDVWRSSRASRTAAWSAPVNVTELNSTARDLPRPLGDHGRTMPMSSERKSTSRYQSYLAVRASPTAAFAAPLPIPELAFPDRSTVDAFLTDDGLTLLYSSGHINGTITEPADLYVAVRSSTSEPFSASAPLSELNTAAEERDPWLSPDGTTLFFVSNRDGILNIYQATATTKPTP
jgi:hypothetical protein